MGFWTTSALWLGALLLIYPFWKTWVVADANMDGWTKGFFEGWESAELNGKNGTNIPVEDET